MGSLDFSNIGLLDIAYSIIILFIFLLSFSIGFGKNRIINFLFSAIVCGAGCFLVLKYMDVNKTPLLIAMGIGGVYGLISIFTQKKEKPNTGGFKPFVLKADKQSMVFFNPYRNFMAIGGANAGKTKSVGKPLLQNYIENNFAGFVYDLKDFDYTKSAYNLISKNEEYPHSFYYINFVDVQRSYRTNIIKPSILDENIMLQLMADILSSYLKDGRRDEWFNNALGILKGVAIRFFYDYPQYCNLPVIVNFCVHSSGEKITKFVEGRPESRALASGFISSQESERTQASILSTLNGYLGDLAFNKNIAWVLSGDDFDFNIIDPNNSKMIAVSNSYALESLISPVIGLMVKVLSRRYTMANKIDTVFFLDEATTFRIDNFETMPSVLREYKASFVLLTQSTAKIEKTYSKLDKNALMANFGNVFYGSISETNDINTFSILFSKRQERRVSKGRSSSSKGGGGSSVNVTVEEKTRYEPHFFKQLKAGEFVGVTSDANRPEFHTRFKMYEYSEEEKDIELPIVHHVSKSQIDFNYEQIITIIKSI